MQSQPLVTLEKVIRRKGSSERLDELLRDPENVEQSGWHMFVPSCFNLALDIQKTEKKKKGKMQKVWTQGSRFTFHAGDIVYDTPWAYKKWGVAMEHINLCVQIETGSGTEPETNYTPRFPGRVDFRVFAPNSDRTRLQEVCELTYSQDEFVEFLINGPDKEILRKISR